MDTEVSYSQAATHIETLENCEIISACLINRGKGVVFTACVPTKSIVSSKRKYKLYCYNGISYVSREGNESNGVVLNDFIGKKIHHVSLNRLNQLILRIDDLMIETRMNADKIMWLLRQPYTEENILMGFPDSLILRSILQKRWSDSFPANHKSWHSFHTALEKKISRSCRTQALSSFVDMMLEGLLGKSLSLATKSPDTNLFLFHFGVGEDIQIIEAFCQIQLIFPDGHRDIFYGDTIHTQFSASIMHLNQKIVQEVSLSEDNNHLEIVFEDYRLKLLPADDGMLSWMMHGDSTSHILAVSCSERYSIELGN